MLGDEAMVAALRACEAERGSRRRDQFRWFEALCVLEQLARLVEGDRRRFGELRDPLGAWIEQHGRFADGPGGDGRQPVRYIVIAESEWARLQGDSEPPSAA
jgi:hypothetical protein